MRSTASRPGSAASALFVGSGHSAQEEPDLPAGFTGWMARIGRAEPVVERVAAMAGRAEALGRTAVATVCLMPERPDEVWRDDAAIAARVEEAGRAALAHPEVVLWLDTFLDIDRGYYIRNGLADRRMRPRAAGFTLAGLQAGDRALSR
jgi:hypothetical protein